MATSVFPLQNAIKKILDDPNSRPKLPNKSLTTDEISTGGGDLVGDDNFSESIRYGTGIAPRIALNNSNVAVEVHQSENHKTLWYSVGSASKDSLTFRTSHEYSNGIKPSVALNDSGRVVEVHQSENESTLWYSVGKVVGDNKIEWSKSKQYDNGERPSVAMTNDGLVVEVHKSQNEDTLWCTVGEVVSDSEIRWQKSEQYDTGIRPSVAITNDGLVVEIHQSENHERIWYTVGEVARKAIILWRGRLEHDTGKRPSIAITNDGLVVEVHQSENENTLWYNSGNVDGRQIAWSSKSTQYGIGENPGVACNGDRAVETHHSRNVLSSSVLELSAFHPEWTKKEGQYSFLFYQMEVDSSSSTRVVANETIRVKSGAAYLLVNLTKGRDSAIFPDGAMLSISGPNGTTYNSEALSEDRIAVVKLGSSLQSLLIKEPVAGDYTVRLSVPANVAFSFSFMTFPYRDVLETIAESRGLQKRGSNPKSLVNNRGVQRAIEIIGFVWVTFRRRGNRIQRLEETAQYFTGSNSPVLEGTPATVTDATMTIAQNIQTQDFNQMIQPPGNVTTAPIAGPVREYVRNEAEAVQWLHAVIRREHLGTGTEASDRARRFIRRFSNIRYDDAGHIVSNELGGTGRHTWNIIPQHRNFNRGIYVGEVENLIYNAANQDGSVEVWYRFHYGNLRLPNRPTRFDILIRFMDGTEYIGDIYNPEYVPRGPF